MMTSLNPRNQAAYDAYGKKMVDIANHAGLTLSKPPAKSGRGRIRTRSVVGVWAIAILLCTGLVVADDLMFDSNGVKIRYVIEGTGKPVVLIHGWMADSSMWGMEPSGETKLQGVEGFQLIALDCRGHGKSDKPLDPAKYGPEMAADVWRLMDQLKIEKAHLIGYSSGAYIAGYVAANHPERVLSVIYGGQAPITEGAKAADFSEVEAFAQIVEEGKDLGSYIIAITPPDRPKPTEEQAKLFAELMYGGKDVKAFAVAGQSFKELEVTGENLRKCTAPVLFIHGANESKHVKHRVAVVRELLGRGELTIIDGGDHITTLAKPEFGSAILEFLRSVEGG